MWTGALEAYATLRRSEDLRAPMLLEAALENLYVQASAYGCERMDELARALAPAELPVEAAWRALILLHLAYDDQALSRLELALPFAPGRSRWLIVSEAARLTFEARGPEAAWRSIADVQPVRANEPWLDKGPLVVHAFLVKLRLAAASGRWDVHDHLVEPACAWFGAPHDPRVIHVRLTCADHDIMRGYYQRATRVLDALGPYCRGDLRLGLLTIRLHALVACAAQQQDTGLRQAIRDIDAELGKILDAAPDRGARRAARRPGTEYCFSAHERDALLRRAADLRDHAGTARRPLEPGQVTSLVDALAVERHARRSQTARLPRETLADLLSRVEVLLLSPDAARRREDWIKLRLLWCRLVVDVGDVRKYEDCACMLDLLIEETTRTGLLPLAMQAYDQRAVLYGPEALDDWAQAVADAGAAGDLAVTLLARNGSAPEEDRRNLGAGEVEEGTQRDGTAGIGDAIMARALLATLLPVLDRTIDLLLRCARAHDPDGGALRHSWKREHRERWYRFGRAIHDYVEQAQVLALQEARRAYGAGSTPRPHRFAVIAPDESLVSPLSRMRRSLRRRDAVIQYFVTGPHILIFFYSRSRFHWMFVNVAAELVKLDVKVEPSTAHAGFLELIARCETWLRGASGPDDAETAEPLRRLLLPEALLDHLERSRAGHVRIIPHDVLYRVPFGRLRWGERTLLERFSLSFHPTGGLAAESAELALRDGAEPDRAMPSRAARLLGYFFDPQLRSAARERARIDIALGRSAAIARMVAIDTMGIDTTVDLDARIQDLDILHIACHGAHPVEARQAFIKLGGPPSRREPGRQPEPGKLENRRWQLSMLASLHLRHCGLSILQSCWTGWVEHERTNPVQGFPQALCDAGVGAVIAPLVRVPVSLMPIFADVFYRMLRFLPADRALQRTLALLRREGAELVADDDEASRDWHACGGLDAVEYRYVGSTNVSFAGSSAARLMGWLSFRQWRWRLRRQRARREAAALPPWRSHGSPDSAGAR